MEINPVTEKNTGYKKSELIGQDWFELVTPKDKFPEVRAEFNRFLGKGKSKIFENLILTKSGEEKYIVWQNSKFINLEKVVNIISFGIDITDRKKSRRES